MKKTVQLIKSGHSTHDIIIDLVKTELIKRNYEIYEVTTVNRINQNIRLDFNIYFTYFLITPINFTKNKKHPCIYGMHGLSLMKNAVGSGYTQFDCSLMPTENWKTYWCKKFSQFKKDNIKVVNGASKLDLFYNIKVNKEEVCKKYNLDHKLPVILYIPSYGTNPEVIHHGSEYLASNILDEIGKLKVNILYLAHPIVTDNGQMNLRKNCKYKISNIKNKSELYAICDIFVGDISGAISESLIFNKPIIRVKKGLEYYKETDFNLFGGKKLVDIGDIVDVSGIQTAIKRNLVKDEYSIRRKWWLDNYVGVIDGQCTKREVDCMETFAKSWWKINTGGKQ